jgi:hypothetical protein
MTIINSVEIDYINYSPNNVKLTIQNNDPIEDKLHVIMVLSNPCQYARRYILAREFIKRMEDEQNIILYIVELAYDKQQFYVTNPNNKRHLQLRTHTAPLWHKENMINIGVKRLLPTKWKAFAWIDADVEFDSASWATDTLKLLNGSYDIVQLFSHAIDMDLNEESMNVFPGFGFQYSKKQQYSSKGVLKMWHPGFAWACTRKTYEKMGGLYEKSILGAGDHNMALSYIRNGNRSLNKDVTEEYRNSVLEFESCVRNIRLGYTPGVIRHYFHGLKKKRYYGDRWFVLVRNQYNPDEHITKNKDGLLIPTQSCPPELLKEIYEYFQSRHEDEGYTERFRELSQQSLALTQSQQSLMKFQTIDSEDDFKTVASEIIEDQVLTPSLVKFRIK